MNRSKEERGSVLPVIPFLIGVILILGGFTIDLGRARLDQRNLSRIASEAALVGTKEAWKAEALGIDGSAKLNQVRLAVKNFAQQNYVNNSPFIIADADIDIGYWDFQNNTYYSGDPTENSARVTVRRGAVGNSAFTNIFSHMFGSPLSLSMVSTTVGVPTPYHRIESGILELPIGVPSFLFTHGDPCSGTTFYLMPTGSSADGGCMGWTTYFDPTADFRNIVNRIRQETYTPPAVTENNYLQFTDNLGDYVRPIGDLVNLYYSRKHPFTLLWTVPVPVYEATDCSIPVGPKKILGFTKVTISQVVPAATHPGRVRTTFDCSDFGASYNGKNGGKKNYGLLANSPSRAISG